VRVMTWNLWWRFGPWEARREAILRVLREVSPDVLGLQEVWADDTGNLAEQLAEELGMHCVHTPSTTPQRWQRRLDGSPVGEGNAVLSRYPVLDHQVLRMPGVDADDERMGTHVRLGAGGHEVPFFTTHLSSPVESSGVRVAQAAELARFVARWRGDGVFPPVLTGDLNAWPDSDEVRLLCGYKTAPVAGQVLMDAWEYAEPGRPWVTWDPGNPFVPPGAPPIRIDYVLVGQPHAGVGRVLDVRRAGDAPVDGVLPSDHYAVVAELALP
jgi:endonuclease/exonuclease/phosphatase family metal-dependent hydrolase